jgi:hypothetical protein
MHVNRIEASNGTLFTDRSAYYKKIGAISRRTLEELFGPDTIATNTYYAKLIPAATGLGNSWQALRIPRRRHEIIFQTDHPGDVQLNGITVNVKGRNGNEYIGVRIGSSSPQTANLVSLALGVGDRRSSINVAVQHEGPVTVPRSVSHVPASELGKLRAVPGVTFGDTNLTGWAPETRSMDDCKRPELPFENPLYVVGKSTGTVADAIRLTTHTLVRATHHEQTYGQLSHLFASTYGLDTSTGDEPFYETLASIERNPPLQAAREILHLVFDQNTRPLTSAG